MLVITVLVKIFVHSSNILEARGRAPSQLKRDFDTVAILVHWRIWKERNARIFQHEVSTVEKVFELIVEDVRTWKAARCIVAL
jgi:hypothetical protein